MCVHVYVCVIQARRRTSTHQRSFATCGRRLNLMQTNMLPSCYGKWSINGIHTMSKNTLFYCLAPHISHNLFIQTNVIIWDNMKALPLQYCADAMYIVWHPFSLPVVQHAQNLLPLLVVAACGGQAGSIFHIVFHLFPVVPSAVYPFLVPIG